MTDPEKRTSAAELEDADGVTVDDDGRVRAKMVKNAKGAAAEDDE
ncbi:MULTISPECIES: hypothetical protein [Halorubrum]|jgi:hypothetical protein|uniref:Uncharacterized protein n=1 Tax=Halorubrum trueperi TaxID=2004704 RepID=A0ABD5UMP1_9EURY|nr:hypothetical protein [Halorubrum sp. CSM-61]